MTTDTGYTMGVILAGGKATRLPNKPLLPMHNGRPLICSSVDYLVGQGSQSILVLDAPDSIIVHVLIGLYPSIRFHRLVDGFKGIPAALALAARSLGAEFTKLFVVCCDNIYPDNEYLTTPSLDRSYAVIREVSAADAVHLAKWEKKSQDDPGRWLPREAATRSRFALTTPWILRKEDALRGDEFSEVTELFNAIDCQPKTAPRGSWKDLGTEDTFIRYWKEKHPCPVIA